MPALDLKDNTCTEATFLYINILCRFFLRFAIVLLAHRVRVYIGPSVNSDDGLFGQDNKCVDGIIRKCSFFLLA